jgi:hypothetical protein
MDAPTKEWMEIAQQLVYAQQLARKANNGTKEGVTRLYETKVIFKTPELRVYGLSQKKIGINKHLCSTRKRIRNFHDASIP